MKPKPKVPARRDVRIVVDRDNPRIGTVTCDGKIIFTLKTDASGMHPSLIAVAAETHLKTMTKGKTGIVLWNGTEGLGGTAPGSF